MSKRDDQVKALSNQTRLGVLQVLDEPMEHFSDQWSADPVKDGVCINLIAEHFGVSQPTMSRHIELLKRAGFLKTKRWQKWTYCSRDEAVLAEYFDWQMAALNVKRVA